MFWGGSPLIFHHVLRVLMYNLELWIKSGAICPRPAKPDGGTISDRKLLHEMSLVKLETGSDGSRVSWVMFGANWSSLYFLSEFITTCVAPITLRYFNAGWFEETLDTPVDAARRLRDLLAKSDVRFAERAYVASFTQERKKMPERLLNALDDVEGADAAAITCAIDTNREIVTVESVGRDSLLGRIWGVSPVSFPCQTGHNTTVWFHAPISKFCKRVGRTTITYSPRLSTLMAKWAGSAISGSSFRKDRSHTVWAVSKLFLTWLRWT